jgi:lipid-binding SYLF domain-containing protein
MKQSGLPILAIFLIVAVLVPGTVHADSHADTIALFQSSPAVKPFFDSAYGFAVLPNVGKGGLIIGAAFGKGKVYRGDTATGTVSLSKMTIGLQLGGQAFSEIIFFEDQRAYREFTSGSFEIDTNASAVAITAGAQAQTGSMGTSAGVSAGPATNTQAGTRYRKGLAVFVHAKGGLMIELSVGGQRFDFKPYQ